MKANCKPMTRTEEGPENSALTKELSKEVELSTLTCQGNMKDQRSSSQA